MKKIILAMSMLIGLNAYAQTSLTGAMGLKFGGSRLETKSAMASKSGFEFYKESSETNSISYMNGSFAGHTAVGAVMHFYNDQLHTITILLDVEQEPKATDLYYEVIGELKNKYNINPDQAHYFRYPYTEGDGHTVTALKKGYADMVTMFKFDDGNVISVSITSSISIKLVYQNTKLADLAVNKNNEKRSVDY